MTHGASLFFSPLDIKIALQNFESSPHFGLVPANEVWQSGHGSLPPSSCCCYRRGTLNALKVNRVYKRDLNYTDSIGLLIRRYYISTLEHRTHNCDLFAPALLYHSYKLKKKKPNKSLKSSFILIMIECQMKPQSCSLLSFIKQNKK